MATKRNILVTSAGQRVSLVRAFQKELKKISPEGNVYTTDLNPRISAACNISDKYFQVPKVTAPEYIGCLLSLCIENNIEMVIPTIDTELAILAENKSLFDNEGIKLIVPSIDFVKTCRDKRITNTFFEQRNINFPKSIDKNNPTFPLFIKPYDGSLSSNIYIINKLDELTEFHLSNEKFMFMEVIDRKIYDEYTIDLYYGADNKIKCIIPRKRISIRAGEILKGITRKNAIVDFLYHRLEYIEGVIGCITLQLFYSEIKHEIIGIEINPRFGGGYPLSYHAGGNYPKWLIEEYFYNKTVYYDDDWEDNLLMLRYDDEILVHEYNTEQ